MTAVFQADWTEMTLVSGIEIRVQSARQVVPAGRIKDLDGGA